MVDITINGETCMVEDGATIVSAAAANDIYIPALCNHSDLPAFRDLPLASTVFRGLHAHDCQSVEAHASGDLEGCGLCVVEVEGVAQPQRACRTAVVPGMSIQTESSELQKLRRSSLMQILSRHPHACLTCAQREGCSLEDCSSNVPKDERCCWKFHDCELRGVAEYVGVKEETPRYRPAGLAVVDDDPLFSRDFNLCIDCSRCVRICNQVRGVEALGLIHEDGRLVVGSIAPTLADSACKFCGACVEVCPTGCLKDKGQRAGGKREWLLPCVGTCPAGVDVPGYIRLIAKGDLKAAAALVWESLPLPNVLSYTCFHLCENECRRGEVDDPIAICALKRFAMEAGNGKPLPETARLPDTGKRVAVVGAGPAGLSAAYLLRFKGHAITVLDAAKSPGGTPAGSLPAYRLPQAVLDKDLGVIRDLGVEIRTGSRLDSSDAMLDLLTQGFSAVVVAVGLPHSRKIELDGSNLSGALWGVEFLTAARAGEKPELGSKVVVVGGGNVAVDAAMTALRLSGGEASMFCLESREQMPAHAHEIDQAVAEGIKIECGWGPAAILGSDGTVEGVEFRRCTSVFDQAGNFAPKFDEQERITVDADSVILAVGQAPPDSVPTEGDGVFLAGDITGGQMSIVHAVASGRSAAERIDRHLGGDGDVSLTLAESAPPNGWIGREEGFVPRRRVPVVRAAPQERCTDFRNLESTYSPEDAKSEAERCLQCDLRLHIAQPSRPPEKWQEFCRANVDQVPTVEGVFILADLERTPTVIKGAANIRASLSEQLESSAPARFFQWEEDRMYSKRESELIQQHLAQYGALPGGGDDELDDLF